jgi:type II secretory pathway pseudopilin PulG
MRRRQAFTIVEMLVAVALIILIMLILTEAFSAGVETFHQLKALGDMQERLRSTVAVLRRDLAADHFEGRRRLSDPNFWSDGYPAAGFFRIAQGTSSTQEGPDLDLALPAPYVIAPVRATDHVLHLGVKLRGNERGDFFSAYVPGSPVLTANTNFFGQPADARYQDTPNTFSSPWAEVVYFLVANGANAGAGPGGGAGDAPCRGDSQAVPQTRRSLLPVYHDPGDRTDQRPGGTGHSLRGDRPTHHARDARCDRPEVV